MKPTVGRIVHFFTKDATKHSNNVGEGPYPALITQVFASGPYVNLKVFRPFADDLYEGSVTHLDDANGCERYWVWPPRE
jgi:hypothetical protein